MEGFAEFSHHFNCQPDMKLHNFNELYKVTVIMTFRVLLEKEESKDSLVPLASR